MNALIYIIARCNEVRAERARAAAIRFEKKAEKLFRRIGIIRRSDDRGQG